MVILTLKKQLNQAVATFFQPSLSREKILSFLQIFLASCFIGICAQIKIPLYFTPVPLTFQTCGVMLVGALLGSRQGAFALFSYLIQGCIGLPVWAGGGAGGFLYFMGPTGGYLAGYVVQAYLIGWFLERKHKVDLRTIVSTLVLSTWIQLGIGSIWLAQFVGMKQCLILGCYPFVLGEAAKALVIGLCVRYYFRGTRLE